VTRRLLNLVSLVMLTTITLVSAARVVCLLPCFTAQTAEATGHCARSSSDDVDRLSAQSSVCDDCEQVGLENADRRTSRPTLTAPHAASMVTLLHVPVAVPPVRMSNVASAAPRGPSPGRAPVPLRI
jgi:hypothetical protein